MYLLEKFTHEGTRIKLKLQPIAVLPKKFRPMHVPTRIHWAGVGIFLLSHWNSSDRSTVNGLPWHLSRYSSHVCCNTGSTKDYLFVKHPFLDQSTSSPGLFTPLPIFNTQSMRFMNSTQFTLINIAETLWMRAEALHNICSRDCNYLSSTFHFVKFAQSGRAQAKWNVNDRCTGYWKFTTHWCTNDNKVF